MSYEIRKVSNGYIVMPPRDYSRNEVREISGMHVFETWEKCAEWLRVKFTETK